MSADSQMGPALDNESELVPAEPSTSRPKNIVELLAMPDGVDVCPEFDSLIPHSRELVRIPELFLED